MSVDIRASEDGTKAIIGVNGGEQFTVSSTGEINGLNIGIGGGEVSTNVAIGNKALQSNTTGIYNTANGVYALYSNTTGSENTASGHAALYSNTTGVQNTASGQAALYANTTGNYNTASGRNALRLNTTGNSNTASGQAALRFNTTGSYNTATGHQALYSNVTGSYNTAVGNSALYDNLSGTNNSAFGHAALVDNTIGDANTAIGQSALRFNLFGQENVAVGNNALYNNLSGSQNTAVGNRALETGTAGSFNVAVGDKALFNNQSNSNTAVGDNALIQNTTGAWNVAVGALSLQTSLSGSYNTAVGYKSLSNIGTLSTYGNCSGLGWNASVTGSAQIQLGNSATTVYAYGAVQDRSDARDKTDIRDTELGLEFISALRPVDFKWDLREDYRPEAPERVDQPSKLLEDASDEERAKYAEELAAYEAYVVKKDKWLEDCKLSNITHDGSKKRNRYHHGLIAQEVKAVLDAKGIDFGGYQDHSVKGGDDVLSIGYEELIAPLIKAVQQLSEQNKQLQTRIEALENK